MQNWIIKLLSFVVSKKRASTLVVTSILCVTLWKKTSEFVSKSELNADFAPYLQFLFYFCVSFLIVEVAIWLWKGFVNILKLINSSMHKRYDAKAFRLKVRNTIPQLPKDQLNILVRLSIKDENLSPRKDGVSYLEEQRYINRIHTIDSLTFIFTINHEVKEEVLSFLAQRRKELLDLFIQEITDHEKDFLRLFFSDSVDQGTRESGKKMSAELYSSGQSLSYRELLNHVSDKKHNQEIFEIGSDLAERLENLVFNEKVKRNQIELDTRHILSAINSGGGASGGASYSLK
jgi:hypothetical protein